MGIDRIQNHFAVAVRWIAFPLHPETPDEGQPLEALFAGRPVHVPDMLDRLREVAAELRLPFGDRRHTFNSRHAQELGKWAEDQGRGDAFHRAAFRAYFADGRNLARHDVLRAVAESAGLDPDAAADALTRRTCQKAVDADWERSARGGITAVPTFRFGRERITGFRPPDDLVQWAQAVEMPAKRVDPG